MAGRVGESLVADLSSAALLVGLVLVERLVVAPLPAPQLPAALAVAAGVAAGLALRRRAPLLGLCVGTVALLVGAAGPVPSAVLPYANQLGVYSVARHADRRRARLGLVITVVGVAGYFAILDPAHPLRGVDVLYVWVLAWVVGWSIARRREQQAAARLLLDHQAVAEERARIAGELHDHLGHTLTVMVVQAGAGRLNPDRAPDLLADLERVGRGALDELERLLEVLDDRPGVDDLPELARRMAGAGLRVELRVAADLEPDLGAAAYRIVQEALTNALRHGDARSARVEIRPVDGVVQVEVSDDGRGAPDDLRPGRGLLGIRERTALLGGTLEYGGGSRGGFRLHARLPLPAPAAARR